MLIDESFGDVPEYSRGARVMIMLGRHQGHVATVMGFDYFNGIYVVEADYLPGEGLPMLPMSLVPWDEDEDGDEDPLQIDERVVVAFPESEYVGQAGWILRTNPYWSAQGHGQVVDIELESGAKITISRESLISSIYQDEEFDD